MREVAARARLRARRRTRCRCGSGGRRSRVILLLGRAAEGGRLDHLAAAEEHVHQPKAAADDARVAEQPAHVVGARAGRRRRSPSGARSSSRSRTQPPTRYASCPGGRASAPPWRRRDRCAPRRDRVGRRRAQARFPYCRRCPRWWHPRWDARDTSSWLRPNGRGRLASILCQRSRSRGRPAGGLSR